MSQPLHNFLTEQGDYTKSYEDFQAQFASKDSQKKLYDFMAEKGDYTKSSDEFYNQFFPQVVQEEVEEETTEETEETTEETEEVVEKTEEPKINTGINREAKYTLDDLVELKDDQFVKEFQNSGIEIDEVGLAMGNAVNVRIPGEDPIYIDLKPMWPNKEAKIEEAKQKIQRILDYQNSLDDNTKKTLGVLTSDDGVGNISQDALDVFAGSGYKITKTKDGVVNSYDPMNNFHAEYSVEFDGEVVFTGTNSEMKRYFIDNPLDETQSKEVIDGQYDKAIELNNIATSKASEEIEGVTKEVAAKEYYENNLANDIFEEFKTGGVAPEGFHDFIKDYFNDDDDATTRSEKIKNFNPEEFLRSFHGSEEVRGDTADDFVKKYLPTMETAWKNIYEEPDYDEDENQTAGGLDKKIAKYAKDKKASITNTYLEKEMENSGLQNVVRSSIYSTSLELEKTKKDLDKATEYLEKVLPEKQNKLKADLDRIINNMVDTILRGSGLPGAIFSTIKNVILKLILR